MKNVEFYKDGDLVLSTTIKDYIQSFQAGEIGYEAVAFYDNAAEITTAVAEQNAADTAPLPPAGWIQSIDSQGNEVYIDPATLGSTISGIWIDIT